MITIKLTLPQAKKRKEHNTKNESDEYDITMTSYIVTSYCITLVHQIALMKMMK